MNIAQTIKRASLFQAFDMETLEQLAKQCHQKSCPKGRDLFVMGDEASAFFIILQGWVKLYRPSRDGEEVIIHIFGPGEAFAEAAVFNDSRAYPVNAQAIEDVTVIEIPRRFFVHKIEEDSRFALRMLGAIAARQHYLVQQLEQVTTRTAPQRIGTFLIRFCRKEKQGNDGWLIDLPYDKSIISTRLNIKPETFSRALAKLEPYGVRVQGRHIMIEDMGRLVEFCDLPLKEVPC
ncbi:MAG: Crp/Fnr family transcriptional regulator [Micavibrio sp.]